MKILMVCLGNICRSPIAEGILRSKAIKENLSITVDSAGTAGYHIGSKPDARMCATAKKFGVNIDELSARQFQTKDFNEFDIIYAMDKNNYADILSKAQSETHKSKVRLILNELSPGENLEVPDPYYGGEDGFVEVFNLLDAAIEIIITNYKHNG